LRSDETALSAEEAGPEANEIALRDVTPADLPTIFAQQDDPEIGRHAAVPRRDRENFEAHWAKLFADPAVRTRAIVAGGELAGYLVLFTRGGHLQVGYWLGREYWGRGLATRALELFLAEIETRPLFAHVASRNLASLRVVEKCGFRRLNVIAVETERDTYDDVVFVLEATEMPGPGAGGGPER